MREQLESGLPRDFCFDFGTKASISSTGTNRAAIKNASSYALCIDALYVACPIAFTATLKAHNHLSTLGTSACRVTPRSAIVGASAAIPTSLIAWYGTRVANSGVSMSGAYTQRTLRSEVSGTIDLCQDGPIILCSNRGIAVHCLPSSQQSVHVSGRGRILPWNVIRTIA